MPAKIVVGLIAGALLLGLVYLEESEDESATLSAEDTQGPEALSWLRKNRSESALASNRFPETRDAMQFVQRLRRAGAVRVIVPLTAIDREGDESYADALVVTLPTEPAARERVWKLCREELQREGVIPDKDAPEQVLLWWD